VNSDVLAVGSSYAPLILTVSVNGGGPRAVNLASVSGGGDIGFHGARDITRIIGPILAIKKFHDGDFTVGQTGGYAIVVTNNGQAATSGAVTVNDFLPQGLVATAISGAGWNCPGLPTSSVTCTRSDALVSGSNYPAILMTVRVDGGGPFLVGVITNFTAQAISPKSMDRFWPSPSPIPATLLWDSRETTQSR
jgi:uncharacterized repeat protein (TIGR01451 family)